MDYDTTREEREGEERFSAAMEQLLLIGREPLEGVDYCPNCECVRSWDKEARCSNCRFDYAALARGKAFRKWFDAQCPDIDYMRLLVLYAEGEALKRSHFSEEDRTTLVYGLLAAPDDVAEGLIRYALEDNRFFKETSK